MTINNYDALVAWIATNVPIGDSNQTLEEKACWFIAYCMGEDSNDFGSRDVGLLFLKGIPPMTPERVTEYLEEAYDADPEDADGCTFNLTFRLKRHFFGPR